MRKISFLLLFLTAALFAQAQVATNIYWVQFTDKNNSPYSIDNPEAYLSPRALERRANQGIAIDEYDIPVNPQYLQAVADCGAQLLNPSKWLNGVSVYTNNQNVVAAINALEFVEVVRNCPNDPKAQEWKERWLAKEMETIESQKNMFGYYGGGETQIKQLNADILHDSGYQGEGMIVAILDGGFIGTQQHHCFDNMREEGRLLGVRDFVYGSTSVYSQSSHGTSCLSTMAAYVPNVFVGTAPKASYFLMHTEDGYSENIVEEYNWVSGAELADSIGADICSTSLGYIDFDMSQWDHPFEHFDGHTAPMTIGAEIAASRGMVCLNAASNEGDGICTLGIPADAEHILTIGAVDQNGNRAYFSSVGPTYDGRIKPDVMAMGQGTYVADGYGDYYNGNGTSFSTPVMAGAVTCLRQSNPYASVQEFCDIVRECGNRANNPDVRYGYGIPDLAKAFEMLHVVEMKADEIINVYPNPSSSEVRVVLKEGVNAHVDVYDFTGRHLYECNFNGLNHNTLENFLNTLGSGVYFVTAISDSGSQTVKIVLTR